MPRLAANLSLMFQEHDFLDRFDAAAAAGFRGVECAFPYDHPPWALAERLQRHALELVLINLAPGDWEAGDRGLAALPGREKEFALTLEQAIRYAQALGCRRLHAMAGLAPAAVLREDAAATYRANLRFAAERLAAEGIVLLIEPINTRDMPGYFLTSAEEAVRLIEEVGSDNLFLQLDLYHRQIMAGDLATCLRANIDRVRHVQIAGVPGRHEPDVGEINYRHLLALLDQLGYGGWVGCEYRPRAGTLDGLGWAAPYGIGQTGSPGRGEERR